MKKFLIFLYIIILFIGGVCMSTYGFKSNKCKEGVLGLSDFAVVTGTSSTEQSVSISYPTGFNKDNCVVISAMIKGSSNDDWGFGSCFNSANTLSGNCSIRVALASDIVVDIQDIRITGTEIYQNERVERPFRIVLMKFPTGDEASLPGDVNLDGSVTNDDVTAVQQFLLGNNPLNFKQYANADMNKDGEVDAVDMVLIQREVNGE